jgi:hypothetical protein
MVNFQYLYRGLCGLANAPRAGALAGHLGAAVTAGYFFGEDQSNLDELVYRGIEKELERIIRGEEAIWYNAEKAGITVAELFEPLPKERPQEELIPTIAKALSRNVNQTRQSGHNVIFAAIGLRGLHDHPQYATPKIVQGIQKLIEGFNNAPPGRGYYGKEEGWRVGRAPLPPNDDFPPYKDVQDMVETVIDELIATASIRRQGFGGLWHLINHAAGIVELSLFDYKSLANQALAAHHQHVRLWRSLPDLEAELGAAKKANHDPREAAYWTTGTLKRDQARLTHRIKTLYGFFKLLPFVQDEGKRDQAQDRLRYLMA